jgi:pimeloyl-ACP methyl ester carboxylesterase
MSAILLDDKMVHYEVLGRGRPIIFLHGWVGSWRYWIPAMQAVAVSFRSYALDMWGFGDTARNPPCYYLDKQTILIDRFLQTLGIGKVALIGHGLGALTAILFSQKNPDVVDRIMAVEVPLEIKSITSRLQFPASPSDLADWLLGKDPITEPARTDAGKTDPEAITLSFTSLEKINMLPLLAAMPTPCLIVHGKHDPAFQALDYKRVMDMSENIFQIEMEESGHFPMLDESVKFNRIMTDFLMLGSGDSPRQLQMKVEWKRRIR